MAFRVTGANSRRTKIDIELPVDLDGEWCYDENDKPIKGHQPVTIVLPRFNYIPLDELKDLREGIAEVEERETTDEYSAEQRSREIALSSLRPFVADEQYKLLENLCLGELEQISQEWARQSAIPLGEFSASNGSSKNTRRQSNTTSSAPAGASAT